MTIITTIQQKKTVEVEVPFFYEESSIPGITKALAVLGETDVISIFDSDTRTSIYSDEVISCGSLISEVINDWKLITEERFMEIHGEVMKKLSLTPVLKSH